MAQISYSKRNLNLLGTHILDSSFMVVERRVGSNSLEIYLNNGEKIELRRFAPVGRGDILSIRDGDYWVKLPNSRGSLQITPAWNCVVNLPTLNDLSVNIKEIETEQEIEGYLRLTNFHYRGGGGVGRRVPLIAIVDCWELPKVVGFIELSSSFLVNTARSQVLNATFSDPETGVAWTRWDNKTAREFANCIVRISRCVVFPELRGVGLATLLVNAAIDFAKQRWHIGGLRPSFIEITAEMLRYWPFVKSCGLHYVGETEGNQHRAAKDMKYLLGRTMKAENLPQGGGGILSLQRSHATMLAEVMRESKLSIPQIVNYLHCSPDKLTDEEWVLLHKVFRRPKPTFMKGLTKSANEFIERRIGIVSSNKENITTQKKTKKNNNELILFIENLQVEIICRPVSSLRSRRVQEAFGIVSSEFYSRLLENLNLTMRRGEIVLIGGPSGTGKSLLLRAIRKIAGKANSRGRLPDTVKTDGRLKTLPIEVAWPKQIVPKMAPVELLKNFSLEESLQILASAGLAEAQLFVRPASTLSVGQAYRLALALSIAKKPDLLLIDQFCEPLDKFTTVAVCSRLRKVSKELGVGIIAATADPEKVARALNPNYLLLLSSSGQHRWVSGYPSLWQKNEHILEE